jgi:hypothetical protein
MTKASGILVAGLVVALGAPAVASAAEPCGCAQTQGRALDELSRHKSAFAGRVKDVREESGSLLVTFDVHRVWKGPRGKALSVKTAAAAASCGYAFATGKDYLVFADGEKDALTTDRCAANAELLGAERSVRQLDLETGHGGSPLRVPEQGRTVNASK